MHPVQVQSPSADPQYVGYAQTHVGAAVVVVDVVDVLVVDVLVVVDVAGRGHGGAGVVVELVVVELVVVELVVVDVVPGPQPFVVWLQVCEAADHVHLQLPLHGDDGRGVVFVVVVVDVVPLEASIVD